MFQVIAGICVIATLFVVYIKTRFSPEISNFTNFTEMTEKSGLVENDFLPENKI
jgi:hypothetical protein